MWQSVVECGGVWRRVTEGDELWRVLLARRNVAECGGMWHCCPDGVLTTI